MDYTKDDVLHSLALVNEKTLLELDLFAEMHAVEKLSESDISLAFNKLMCYRFAATLLKKKLQDF